MGILQWLFAVSIEGKRKSVLSGGAQVFFGTINVFWNGRIEFPGQADRVLTHHRSAEMQAYSGPQAWRVGCL
jgi:hypothetical protein